MSSLSTADVFSLCVASVARVVHVDDPARGLEVMRAEIGEIARSVAEWRLSGEAKARLFLRPMEEELVRQYGTSHGRRLYWEFVEAFWLRTWSGPATGNPSVPEASVEPMADLLVPA